MNSWTQEILGSVWREQDRKLLEEEAIKCLDAGALRSAYIMTWVTIAESLKATLREMSLRDNGIQRIVGKIEELETQEKAIDGFLLEKSIELGIIRPDQQYKIRHLYTMRSLYTHPYETGPSEDEVRAAIRIAIEGVLSRKPFFRHGYVTDRLAILFQNPHFLDDNPSKIEAYGRDLADRVDPTLWKYFLEKLVSGLESIVDDPELDMIVRRCLSIAKAFICHVDADLSAEQWQAISFLERWPKAAGLIFRDPRVWGRLGEQAQDMTLSLQLFPARGQGTAAEPNTESLEIFVSALEKSALTEGQAENVKSAVGQAGLQLLANSSVSMVHWADRIVKDLESHNWYVQNPAVSALTTVGAGRVHRECNDEMQEALGRNISQAADGNARFASSFLLSLGANQALWPDSFIKGILFEFFVNEEQEIRFKTRMMKTVILGVLRHSQEKGEALIRELSMLLRESEPKYPPLYDDEVMGAVTRCESALSELTADEEVLREAVNDLRSALEALSTEQRPPSPF